MNPRPIVLDCDPGHDDALAITLALARPELELLGITTVGGNSPLANTTRNALRVLALLGRSDVPVAPGGGAGAAARAAGPRWSSTARAASTARTSPSLQAAPRPEGALALTEALVAGAGRPVTLVATGPLTNVALLLRARPRIREGIERICLMGGSLGEGNTTAAAEFNIWQDPEAAAIVFGSGIPISMMGLDVTHRALFLEPDVARLEALGTRIARVWVDLLRFFAVYHRAPLRLGRLADPRRRRRGPPGGARPGHDPAPPRRRGDRRRADPGPDGRGSRRACGGSPRTSRPASTSTGRGSSTCSWRRSPRSAEARARAGRGTMAAGTGSSVARGRERRWRHGCCSWWGRGRGRSSPSPTPRARPGRCAGPLCEGWPVHDMSVDAASGAIYAAAGSPWYGPAVWRSDDLGETWTHSSAGLTYGDGGPAIPTVWNVTAAHGAVFAGVEPAGLFRSDDGGATWSHVAGLTEHPSRPEWQPGNGGLILHTIVPHATDPRRMWVGISAVGTFETRDGGATWETRNRGVRADFVPDPAPEFGQCVHKLVAAAGEPETLYQQNHCGVYRSDDGGVDLGRDHGRPALGVRLPDGRPSARPGDRLGDPAQRRRSGPLHARCGRRRLADPGPRGHAGSGFAAGLPQEHAYLGVLREAMAVDRLDPVGVFFGTSNGELWASADEGATWHQVAAHLPDIWSVEALVVED